MMGPFFNKCAVKGAKLTKGKHGRMCNDCACKLGSAANKDEAALMALEGTLLGGRQFNCHTKDFKDACKPCAGFLYIKESMNSVED